MAVALEERKKLVLLRSASRRGPRELARQAYLTFCDTFLRKRHLIYHATADDVLSRPLPEAGGIAFREVRSWAEFRPEVRAYLMANQEALEWGDPSWFDRGWRLWIGEIEGDLATMCWWRPPEHSKEFFTRLPEDAELMWQSTTIPKYRGRGLFTVQRRHLLHERVRAGTRQFFVCCQDFNMTGRRNLPRQGFRLIGCSVLNRMTGRRRWHPVAA